MEYSALQQKGFEIAKHYAPLLTLKERIEVIARSFGCKTGNTSTRPCTGSWRGQSDISINLDNGSTLWIGTRRTPQAKTAKTINECVNNMLAQYNPKIVNEARELATAALLKREAEDNAIAARMGLKPYTFLKVELNNGADTNSGGYLGWYYVTLAVEDNIFAFIETGLNYDIARGVLSEQITRPQYFVAGGIYNNEEDFVFNNVGHSSFNGSHQISFPDDARDRAEKALYDRICGADGKAVAMRHPYLAQKVKREYGSKKPLTYADLKIAEQGFSNEINKLFTGTDPYACRNWVDFAYMQSHMGKQSAAQTLSELREVFASVKKQYGDEIAAQTFNMGSAACLQPSLIPKAAAYLKNDVSIDRIISSMTDGKSEMNGKKLSITEQLADAKKAVAEINKAAGKEAQAADRKKQGEAL